MVVKSGRALHFVFKVADRAETTKFYLSVLGMKALRHEEFQEGCDAACNGPYDNRWSKTMVGYGPEDTHFVVELTYNYNVHKYEQGNDFQGITIRSREAIERAKAAGWPIKEENGVHVVEAPGGYKYFLLNEPQPTDKDPVEKVTLSSSNLARTLAYWNEILGLKIFSKENDKALLAFAESQAKLEFKDIGKPVDHATAYGRIAYSVPKAEQPVIDKKIKETGNKILTPLITLDTPGKASVTVIILADPDEHEICFVDDESFRVLSEVDPKAEASLYKYIEKDEKRRKV
ncbi:glyoxalase domain-containing protein 4-like isoform X2 [Macrosteles quadrilineatus]|uniref:glyoxalase domain-containing protein 4-like isoform X2 n=1 Tax=Macrosteles quadrilineatus TaxID=74068 RepID=UPI0023E123FE|nr:glyoxalase domain-containing protein 4-like isoform X2 [Macrosteles quadrilineatus]